MVTRLSLGLLDESSRGRLRDETSVLERRIAATPASRASTRGERSLRGSRYARPAPGRSVRTARRQPFDDPDQPIAVRIRQGTQQHGVDDADNGRRGADAERERDHSGGSEPGIAGETARRARNVAPHIVQPEERRCSHLCYLYNMRLIEIACRDNNKCRGLLFGITPVDPQTSIGVPLLIGLAIFASYAIALLQSRQSQRSPRARRARRSDGVAR